MSLSVIRGMAARLCGEKNYRQNFAAENEDKIDNTGVVKVNKLVIRDTYLWVTLLTSTRNHQNKPKVT